MDKKLFQCRRFSDWLELELLVENLGFYNSPLLCNIATSLLIRYSYPHLILDLNSLLNIDSPEIGVMLHLSHILRKNNRVLMLLFDNEIICEIFKITKLNTVFTTFPARDQALSYLNSHFPIQASADPIEILR